MKKTKLLYRTFDGDLKKIWVTPNYLDTNCSFRMEVWGGAEGETKKTLLLNFDHVAALEFSMNFCDNMAGADLGGFYKVPGKKQKRKLLERNFNRRKKDWLMTRLSDSEDDDQDSLLNDHSGVDQMEEKLSKYNLYLLQSMGGAWLVLAREYECVELDENEALSE
ncbi:MAG: hypothetical protein LUC35_06175 [Clostridiales bacterium]|nr:hypothetical protein [Clostridiales bacterium]